MVTGFSTVSDMNFIFVVCLQKVSMKCSFWSCLILVHLVAHEISVIFRDMAVQSSTIIITHLYCANTSPYSTTYQANIVLHDQHYCQ